MMQTTRNHIVIGLLLAILSTPVLAHTGVGSIHDFATGFAHPWQGPDHLLAMFAVGLWAMALGGRVLLPVAFLSLMGLGAVLAASGWILPYAEWGVSGSVLALGLVLWRNRSMASGWAVALVGMAALFHGHAHGAEITAEASASLAGILAATALLHGLGMAVGHIGRDFVPARRGFGLLCAGIGIYFLAGMQVM